MQAIKNHIREGTVAEAIISTWKEDEHIRHEFKNDLTTFASFVQNKGDEGLALVGLCPGSDTTIKEEDDMSTFFDITAAEQKWSTDPKLREEFHGNKASYLAYAKADAEGHVKTLGKQAAS